MDNPTFLDIALRAGQAQCTQAFHGCLETEKRKFSVHSHFEATSHRLHTVTGRNEDQAASVVVAEITFEGRARYVTLEHMTDLTRSNADLGDGLIAEISALFSAYFVWEREDTLLEDFARGRASAMVWPCWHEFFRDQAARLRLPSASLPRHDHPTEPSVVAIIAKRLAQQSGMH